MEGKRRIDEKINKLYKKNRKHLKISIIMFISLIFLSLIIYIIGNKITGGIILGIYTLILLLESSIADLYKTRHFKLKNKYENSKGIKETTKRKRKKRRKMKKQSTIERIKESGSEKSKGF